VKLFSKKIEETDTDKFVLKTYQQADNLYLLQVSNS